MAQIRIERKGKGNSNKLDKEIEDEAHLHELLQLLPFLGHLGVNVQLLFRLVVGEHEVLAVQQLLDVVRQNVVLLRQIAALELAGCEGTQVLGSAPWRALQRQRHEFNGEFYIEVRDQEDCNVDC